MDLVGYQDASLLLLLLAPHTVICPLSGGRWEVPGVVDIGGNPGGSTLGGSIVGCSGGIAICPGECFGDLLKYVGVQVQFGGILVPMGGDGFVQGDGFGFGLLGQPVLKLGEQVIEDVFGEVCGIAEVGFDGGVLGGRRRRRFGLCGDGDGNAHSSPQEIYIRLVHLRFAQRHLCRSESSPAARAVFEPGIGRPREQLLPATTTTLVHHNSLAREFKKDSPAQYGIFRKKK